MQNIFNKIFGTSQAQKFFSPGRVNLIGEHTDHEGGFVFPCAINLGISALAQPRTDDTIRLYSMNFDEGAFTPFEIKIDEIKSKSEIRTWVNYPLGVVNVLKNHGYKFGGADILYNGNLPGGAGLSSSAAIEVLTGKIFSELYKLNIDGVKMARFSQEAENNFVGMNCGIMDQFAVSMGKKNCAVLLNCSTLEYSYAPLELENFKIVITNSNVPHSLAGSEYNLRRQQCEAALADIKTKKEISCLCDLTPNELDEFSFSIADPVNLKRARHAVSENARAIRASEALKAGDLNLFGRLMNASHVSLRDDYQVTVPELDILASLAWKLDGVVGSRMTGGGFGGCTVSIVENNSVENFKNSIGADYERLTGRKADFYVIETSDGAGKCK
ncbi:MAG: galactokinase [Synergistaceae bacterium]|nr:galactokinase [Synergistaceae bacterium]